MHLFHDITVSVFIKPEEDYHLISTHFYGLFPFDLKKNKVVIEEKNASTFRDRTIKVIEATLTKRKSVDEFIDFIKEKMSDADKLMLINQINSRLDDELNFFFRLSKKRLIHDDVFVVVDHGNCYHFKCHVVTYPKNVEVAKKMLIDYFS